MCAQEKYHQPDHWVAYRFPKGQARKPILGMRHSDATLFCQWLTERNQDGWRYRLPNETEAQEYPLQKPYTLPIGYWLEGISNAEFAWIRAKPSKPRVLARDIARDISLAIYIDRDIDSVIARDIDSNIARALDRTLARDIDLDLDRALDRACDIDRDIDRDRNIARAIGRGNSF